MSQGLFAAVEALGQVVSSQRSLIETQAQQLKNYEAVLKEESALVASTRVERDGLKLTNVRLRGDYAALRGSCEDINVILRAERDENMQLRDRVARFDELHACFVRETSYASAGEAVGDLLKSWGLQTDSCAGSPGKKPGEA